MTDDLAAFVAARLGEDERYAKAAASPPRYSWYYEQEDNAIVDEDGDHYPYVATTDRAPGAEDPCGVHIVRHDPARVLREVAAKRVILELHDRVHECPVVIPVPDPSAFDGTLGYVSTEYIDGDDPDVYPCTTLRQLAAVYDSHADYRAEWKP